jgi:hypothetical protein
MHSLIFTFSRLCTAALTSCCLVSFAFAQDANVLGLPAIPQPKLGAAASPAKSAASAPAAATSRDILAGELGLQHSALNGVGRLIITTRATFATAGAKSAALDAARGVQLELGKACGKQCKPEKMSAPKFLSNGQMEFELAFRPLYQHLNQTQFLAALQSKPLNLTPTQLTAPAAVPASVAVNATATAGANTPTTP